MSPPLGGRVDRRTLGVVLLVVSLLLVGCAGRPQEADAPTAPAPEATTPAPEEPDTAPEEPLDTEPALLEDPYFEEWAVPAGTRPHDVAPGLGGRVWYTGQGSGDIGVLDPEAGEVDVIGLDAGAAPHGVIVAEDGSAWITDGGLNAIVVVHPDTYEVTVHPLSRPANARLNTATFAGDGIHWFTGQAGVHGRLDPETGEVAVFDSPRGIGPYGIATTPGGDVWFSSLAGSYIARVTDDDGNLEVVDVPTVGGGARRVWSDSTGSLWVTEWFAGNLARYEPASGQWDVWPLPGDDPQPYAVFVDDADMVWVTDFSADALVRFDPATEQFRPFPWPTPGAQVRQLLGRPGEVWGAGSGTDTLIVLRTR